MELEFQTTEDFERDLSRFSAEERERIARAINTHAQLALRDRKRFKEEVKAPVAVQLAKGLTSSLYSMKAGRNRVIFTLVDDPLFDRVLVTLYRAVQRDSITDVFQQVVQALYSEDQLGHQNGAKSNGIKNKDIG